jgi:hypothetical protein
LALSCRRIRCITLMILRELVSTMATSSSTARYEIAVALQLGRKLFRFRGQSLERDVGGDDNVFRNREIDIGQRLGRLPGDDLADLAL